MRRVHKRSILVTGAGPGCCGWQVDGLTFTEVIVVKFVCEPRYQRPADLGPAGQGPVTGQTNGGKPWKEVSQPRNGLPDAVGLLAFSGLSPTASPVRYGNVSQRRMEWISAVCLSWLML
jgi:hypothetical protein